MGSGRAIFFVYISRIYIMQHIYTINICVYVCICVCIYIYIHVYEHMYIYIYNKHNTDKPCSSYMNIGNNDAIYINL